MFSVKGSELADKDLQEIVDSSSEDSTATEEVVKDGYFLKCEKTCRKAIARVGYAQSLWFVLALMAILAIGVVLYLTKKEKFYELSDWGFEQWITSVIGLIFLILACTRISSNSGHLSKLKDRNKYLRGDLPNGSDRILREIYFYYCKRRCTHYWLTVGFGAMFMLCILYPILACGVDMLYSWKWTPSHVKLFDKDTIINFSHWKVEHKFCATGIIGVFLSLAQYFIFRENYMKTIVAFEDRFGREKIVDECLYCSRMFKINFRYKSFAFMVVCFCGCFFYLLFKRLICVIFDKSFIF